MRWSWFVGPSEGDFSGLGESDERIAAKTDVGGAAHDPDALRPELDAIRLYAESEPESAATVAVGLEAAGGFRGRCKGGGES